MMSSGIISSASSPRSKLSFMARHGLFTDKDFRSYLARYDLFTDEEIRSRLELCLQREDIVGSLEYDFETGEVSGDLALIPHHLFGHEAPYSPEEVLTFIFYIDR